MIVDSHVHLKHGDLQRTEYSPEVIVDTMDKAGIDRSIVFAMSTSTSRSVEMALEAYRRFPTRLIPYVYGLPSYEKPVLREIEEALVDLGFRGIKLHAGECTLAGYVVDPVLDLAERLGVPCLIDFMGRFWDLELLAEKFKEAKIIVAHFGRYLCEDEHLVDRFIKLAESHRNVWLDTSGVLLTGKIRDAVERIGSDRIVFGTDGPQEKPDTVSFARREIEKIKSLNLDPEDERMILSGSITELLEL